jgi:hypothetical protein
MIGGLVVVACDWWIDMCDALAAHIHIYSIIIREHSQDQYKEKTCYMLYKLRIIAHI